MENAPTTPLPIGIPDSKADYIFNLFATPPIPILAMQSLAYKYMRPQLLAAQGYQRIEAAKPNVAKG